MIMCQRHGRGGNQKYQHRNSKIKREIRSKVKLHRIFSVKEQQLKNKRRKKHLLPNPNLKKNYGSP